VRPRLDIAAMMATYLDILTPIIAAGFPDSLLQKMAASREADLAAVREGRDETGEASYRLRVTAPPDQIRAALDLRAAQKQSLEAFFTEGWDAVLMPITPFRALKHDHSEPPNARTVDIDGTRWPYFTGLNWISLATSLHAPAVAVPAGQSDGLPVGVQLVGPWNGEDKLLELAAALEAAMGGFSPPPAYS
jgi:amidase